MRRQQSITRAIAVCVTGAITVSAISPVWAAPVLSSTAVVKSSLPSDTLRVRNRSRAIVAGAVIGALVGAAAARNRYYYGPGYYAPGYYAPGYYGPGYGYYGPYGGGPYPYGGYAYGYDYDYGRGNAIAAGALIGTIIGTAAAQSYRSGRYRYAPVYDSRGYYGGRVDTNAVGNW